VQNERNLLVTYLKVKVLTYKWLSLQYSMSFADAPPAVDTHKEKEKGNKKLKNKEPIYKVNNSKQIKNDYNCHKT
ncbi:13183_t:CDS:1, partial [Funneliformis caledonium]